VLRIERVEGYHDLGRFIHVPWSIYADDPCWVPPLKLERRLHFTRHNPYFQHADWAAWIAYRGNHAVGRISAQVDRLSLERHADNTGSFGLIEAEDNRTTFTRLFNVAEQWLVDQGMVRARGPFNLSINDECGLLVDGFDTPPSIMMGHARKYYGEHVEACGYEKAVDVFAYRMHTDFPLTESMKKIIGRSNRIRKGVFSLRSLRRDDMNTELEVLRDIFNEAWGQNWGFVPFTETEFRELGTLLKSIVDVDYVKIGELDGEPIAFIVCLPNINEFIADLNGRLLPFGWLKLLRRLKNSNPTSVRVPLMGIRKEFQGGLTGSGISLAMIHAVKDAVLRHDATEVEMGWILEHNKSMRSIIEAIGGVVAKRYRLYEKILTN
jgi:hypothetical protein